MSRFSFDTRGAKEKLAKENAEKEISPSAEGAKGYSPLTSQTFGKVWSKLFVILKVRIPLSASWDEESTILRPFFYR